MNIKVFGKIEVKLMFFFYITRFETFTGIYIHIILVGCSPWGLEESDTTERLPFHFLLSRTGEGNGTPLQYSCLENAMDGGAW